MTLREGLERVRHLSSSLWTLRVGVLLSAAFVSVLGVVARQQGIPRFRTVYAEDGAVFAQCAYDDSLLRCLATPYDAWIHVLPRILASVATAFDPSLLSYALTALVALVTAGAALLVARAVADATGSYPAALIAAAGLTLVYPAARGDVIGSVTNMHWILLAAGVTVTVSSWVGHRFDWADGVLVAILVTGSPFSLLIVAFAAVGAMLRRPRMLPVALLAGVVALIQLGVALTAPRIELPNGVDQGSPIQTYLVTVVQTGLFGARGWVPDGFVTGALIGTILAMLALMLREGLSPARAQPGSRILSSLVDIAAVVALIASGVAVFAASWLLNHHVVSRHIYAACALTVVALVVGLGRLFANPATGGMRRRVMPFGITLSLGSTVQLLVALVVAIGFATSFRVQNAAGRGPDFRTEVVSERAQCSAGAAAVPITISPLPTADIASVWQIVIPCSRLES